jgi:hypothetical protein
MSISKAMDPFSGRYSMSAEDRMPSWEKGSKLPHWDSSDLSGISSSSSSSSEEDNSSFDSSFNNGDASYVSDSDDDAPAQTASPNANPELIKETETTPRAGKRHLHKPSTGSTGTDKGKGKAKNQDEDLSRQSISPPSQGSTGHGRPAPSSSRTRPRRPRSNSNASNNVASPPFLASLSPPSSTASADNAHRITSKRAPGPAAQAMADFMSTSNKPSSSQSSQVNSSFQGLMPASAFAPSSSKLGARPLSRPLHLMNSNRQLGRATSAPNNLFAESLPTNNLFSPGGSRLAPTEEECELSSPSPEADMQTIMNRAYEARSGSIDLS